MAEKPKKPTEEQLRESLRAAAAVVMAPPGSFSFEKPEAKTDVFDAPLGAIVGTAGLRAQASQSRDPLAAKDARVELSKQRAKTRAASPRPGGMTMAEGRERLETWLRSLSPEQRDAVIWAPWYDALSERKAQLVDEILLELDEEVSRQEAVAEYARSGGGESEQTQALNAWLDDETVAYADELDLEDEAAEIDYEADYEAGLDVAS
jgi:hypothetical protein